MRSRRLRTVQVASRTHRAINASSPLQSGFQEGCISAVIDHDCTMNVDREIESRLYVVCRVYWRCSSVQHVHMCSTTSTSTTTSTCNDAVQSQCQWHAVRPSRSGNSLVKGCCLCCCSSCTCPCFCSASLYHVYCASALPTLVMIMCLDAYCSTD